mgnify:CR=1 FL=1
MDIGAVISVEAYNVGLQVPGQIKSSFNRPRGGTIEKIKDKSIIEYSKSLFNKFSKSNYFKITPYKGGLLNNLPEFDLEELVISYLQIKENYYVLSNSIANKSTTIKIECEMISRDVENHRKAVVQVKGKKAKELDALGFKQYVDEGYLVYLYAPRVINLDKIENVVRIGDDDLLDLLNSVDITAYTLSANPKSFSNLIGHKAKNRYYFEKKLSNIKLNFRSDSSIPIGKYKINADIF